MKDQRLAMKKKNKFLFVHLVNLITIFFFHLQYLSNRNYIYIFIYYISFILFYSRLSVCLIMSCLKFVEFLSHKYYQDDEVLASQDE